MKNAPDKSRERQKIAVMAFLLAAAFFMIYLFHVVLRTGAIFTHFFYIPVILGALWWKRKSLFIPVLLATALVISHSYLRVDVGTPNDYVRALMFIVVGLVVAELSVRVAKSEAATRSGKEKLEHLHAILGTVRSVNQLITREKDRGRLMKGVCEIIIETRGYRHAWIALFDPSGSLTATAEAGLGEKFLPLRERLERGESFYCREKAMSRSGPVVIPEPLSICAGCPLAPKSSGRGAMACSLEHGGKRYGLLSVCTTMADFAEEEEKSLFRELTDDVAFALYNLEIEDERKRALASLRESEDTYRTVFENTGAATLIVEEDMTISLANLEFAKLTGYPLEEIAGKMKWTEFVATGDLERMKEYHRLRRVDQSAAPRNYEFQLIDRHGQARNIHNTVAVIPGTKKTVLSFIEITELKRVEKSIRESHEMYKSLMKTSPDAVTVTDLQGNITEVSRRTIELHGCESAEEMIGKSAFDLIDPNDRARAERNMRRALEEGLVRNLEYVMRKKDGGNFIGELSAALIRDAQGNPKAFIATTRDVTMRRLVEENLKIKEDALTSSISAFVLSDFEGCLTYVNPAFLKMWGYQDDREVLGKPATDFWRSSAEASQVMRLLREREGWAGELVAIRKDGSLFDVQVSTNLVRNKAGDTIGMMASFVDITERKHAEAERMRLAAAVEQAAEGVVIIGRDKTIQYVNPAFERISGYARQEITGRHLSVLEGTKYDREFHRSRWEKLQRGEIWTGRITNERRDGTLYTVESAISPIRNDSGEVVNFVAVERDITHEVHLEKQLRQAQKMEAIGTLAGGIAHDFNNILGAIMGYIEIGLLHTPKKGVQRRNLEQALRAGNRGKELVKQITAFSRQKEQERKPVQPGPIVKETLKFLRASIPSTVSVQENTGASTGVILADPAQINQVLINLCSNAAHAMRERGGILEVSLADQDFNEEALADHDLDADIITRYPEVKPGPYVRLTVSDTGHGMDKATLERIFDPYFTTKEPSEGTGMGLAVVHGIIKNHGGFITVYSEVGVGTTFKVYLPQVRGDLSVDADVAAPVPKGNERILFVDDEKDLVDIARQMLKHLGYEVTTATSSTKALETFRARPERFDLVITDQTMPKMTGIELAREVKKIRDDIPIILCTGFSEVVTPEHAKRETGIREFIMKPISSREMAAAIRRALT